MRRGAEGLLPGRTAAFEAFVAPARAQPAVWRLCAGFVLVAAVWLALSAALLPLVPLLPEGAERRGVLVLYLAGFGGMILGVGLAVRLLQRRRLATLIGPAGFRPGRFGLGVAAIVAVGAVSVLPVLILAPPVRQASVAVWAGWLPLAVPALVIQTAAEELVFRGYLMQGLAARFRSRFVWWVVPSMLFGTLHWNPGEFGSGAWIGVLSAAVIGLVLADVTARTGDLSLAMGLHFANNALALLVLATPGEVASLSLFVAGVDPADEATMRLLLLADLATTLLAYAVWLAFRSRQRGRLHSAGPGSI